MSTRAKQTKHQLRMQIKQIDADGTFKGLLATYGNVDLGNDVIVAGAFTKTIQEHGAQVPLLWQHKPDEPIGTLTLNDTATALECSGQLLMDLPIAQKAYLLLKSQIIKGLSIGYDVIKDTVDNNVRFLKELRLWEGSIVTFPMNEQALVTTVKALRAETKDDFSTELASQQIADAGSQIFQALYYALTSLTWSSSTTKEEKIEAAQETLSQFTEAYMAYLPVYLDWLDAEYGPAESMSRTRMERKMLALAPKLAAKEGRTISSATGDTLSTMRDHVMGIEDHVDNLKSLFQTLLPDEADDADEEDEEDDGEKDVTPTAKAAKEKTEPETHHSAEIQTVDSIIAFLKQRKVG